ncbi:MAG: hypothetical protein CVU03_05730 [Bacteroidetes bacterium HGW-Bacteroidetes-2]|jgi:hypothetical protein|nr:MAG: hypothetical protein CVU03_05730 [Bacteroidetes bacterium HGW-Bacteroidetes-2]
MKHLLLSATMLLFSATLLAQIHVQPNGTTDSYVFVNNEILFVTDYVSLLENTVDSTNASIYLRNDGQLIQGGVASTNTGTGKLSVWQRGFANAFDYNYWASPVGNPAGNPGNTNFGISKLYDVQDQQTGPEHLTNSILQSYTTSLNGIPSGLGLATDLQVSSRWIYTMRALSGYANWVYIGTTDGLKPGEGFTMKGTGTYAQVGDAHEQLYDFRGRPNSGNITVIVKHTDSIPQETLTGNPYPSALDMREFLLDSDNRTIQATAYYWDQSRTTNSHNITAYQGGYGTWNPNGGTIDPIYGDIGVYVPPAYIMYDGSGNPIQDTVGNGDSKQRRFAPIGQGFMVRGDISINNEPNDEVAIFKNSMRRFIPKGASTFSEFRTPTRNPNAASVSDANGPTPIEEPVYATPGIRIHTEINNTYIRDMLLMFSDETTWGEDRGWDARHPLVISGGDTFWKLRGSNARFVIQTLPFDENEYIPFGLTASAPTTFKIKIVDFINFNKKVFLFDRQLNTFSPLWEYVELSLPAGTYENRFYISFVDFNERALAEIDKIKEEVLAKVEVFQNNRISQLEVNNPEIINIKNASVYDMGGKLVINEKNLGSQQRYSFSTANLSSGVYLVKLITAENVVIDYKVTVHNKN